LVENGFELRIWCSYEVALFGDPTMPAIKITESVRKARLRRPFERSVTRDSEIPGFTLIVTSRRAFWALLYQPRGTNPSTSKRWGGGTRLELGDAHQIPVKRARAAALAAKALVRAGRDPHREHMAARAGVEASRSIIPPTVGKALDDYAEALAARGAPSEWSRRQAVHYARKAVRLMRAETLPLAAIDVRMARLMFETMTGSQAEKYQVHSGLRRFQTWARRQGLISVNVCDALERDERPKPGKPRFNVPSLEELRAVWAAVESESASVRDAVRLLLLTALRRDEGVCLPWGEVDFVHHRLVIPGDRMKNGEPHEVPLSPCALALLQARMPANPSPRALVFPSSVGKPIANWGAILARIRKAIGQANSPKAQRFVFHDVRRSFVSILSKEFDADALDQALAHKRSGIAAVYNHSTRMEARLLAFPRWADLLVGVAAPSNVAPFARRAHV
jgi:integrase